MATTNMENINEKVIEQLLSEKDNDATIKVSKIHLEPAVGKGENFMSVAIKITVHGTRFVGKKNVEFTKSLFAKKQFESKETTELLESDKLFGNEATAYNEVIPTLEEYLGEKLAVAKCYRADNKHLILEDLFASGYGMIEGQKSLTVEQACAVLKELAIFHSASYILKSKNLPKFKLLTTKVFEIFSTEKNPMKMFIDKSLETSIRILQSIPLSDELQGYISKLQQIKTSIIEDVTQLLNNKTETDIFNHGDCWMNNLLFKPPLQVKLVDLQIVRYTSPAADLSYFLYINLFPSLRKEKFTFFLNFYLKNLHQSLEKHQLHHLIKILDLKWLQGEMKRFSRFGLMFGLMIFPIFYINKNDLPDMENAKEHMDKEEDIIGVRKNQEYQDALLDFLKIYFEEHK